MSCVTTTRLPLLTTTYTLCDTCFLIFLSKGVLLSIMGTITINIKLSFFYDLFGPLLVSSHSKYWTCIKLKKKATFRLQSVFL